MTWTLKKLDRAYTANLNGRPYRVRQTGSKWTALRIRFTQGTGTLTNHEHLGVFTTPNEAKTACENHARGNA